MELDIDIGADAKDWSAIQAQALTIGTIENLPAVLKSMGILLAYIILFTGSAIVIFKKKDILS